MYKNHIFQVTTKHLHLDLFVDFQQKVSKYFIYLIPPKKKYTITVFIILKPSYN